MYNICSVNFSFYAIFKNMGATSVTPLISPQTPIKHEYLLERETETLAYGGIGTRFNEEEL